MRRRRHLSRRHDGPVVQQSPSGDAADQQVACVCTPCSSAWSAVAIPLGHDPLLPTSYTHTHARFTTPRSARCMHACESVTRLLVGRGDAPVSSCPGTRLADSDANVVPLAESTGIAPDTQDLVFGRGGADEQRAVTRLLMASAPCHHVSWTHIAQLYKFVS